jgi:ComF family protein
VNDLLRGLLDLVFAPACVACGGVVGTAATERIVCVACWARARPLPAPRCERCWVPLAPGAERRSPCPACADLRPAIRAVRSAFLLEGPVRSIVHALKYRGWHAVAAAMATRLAAIPWPAEVEAEVELVVPVPLSATRERERGYNQAALLARELSALRGWKAAGSVLERRRSAGTQTTLHPAERRANVAGAFRVRPGASGVVSAAHVLVLDDVWTTGATALACSDALLESGARAVSILTFARALPELERHDRRVEAAALS